MTEQKAKHFGTLSEDILVKRKDRSNRIGVLGNAKQTHKGPWVSIQINVCMLVCLFIYIH